MLTSPSFLQPQCSKLVSLCQLREPVVLCPILGPFWMVRRHSSLVFNPIALNVQQKDPSPPITPLSTPSQPPHSLHKYLSFLLPHLPSLDGSPLRSLIPSHILHCNSEQDPLKTATWEFREGDVGGGGRSGWEDEGTASHR